MGIKNTFENVQIKNPFQNKKKPYKCPFCLHEHTKEEFSYATTRIPGTNRKIISSVKCPECQERLPHSFFEDDTKIISIIGDRYVGKTYYAISLINFLETNSTLHRLGINSELIGDKETKDRIKQLQALKRAGQEFDQTKRVESKAAWVLKITCKGKSIYISFFDNAGEGFAEREEILNDIEQANKHNLVHADALLFLFAPYQLNCFNDIVGNYCKKYGLGRNRFGRPYPKTESSIRNDFVIQVPLRQVISNVKDLFVDLINDAGEKSKINAFLSRLISKRVNIPTAFCLTQYDVIKDQFVYQIPEDDKDDEFEMEYFKDGEFDYSIIDSYSKEIHKMLYEDGKMYDLKNAIEPYFVNYKYFTTQSIERNDEDKQTFRDMPRGCTLPIIWLFKELNIVRL
ncbi:hypothetical protein FACS1894201_03030 [Bacteroidia bacterium]|nr:hypothetical protein FACS1894201_03030 [Bacteroidia bacterium]